MLISGDHDNPLTDAVWSDQVREIKAELAQARQEIYRLREALDDYGEHLPRCKFWDGEDCSCGYRAALNGVPERAP